MTAPRVAVVIPCFNVAPHVDRVVASIPPEIAMIVAVDDGSRDQTAPVLASLTDRRLVCVRHDTNQGVGAAVLTGYRVALERGAEVCVKMDGDGQMAGSDIPTLLEPVVRGEADYSKGNRFWDFDALRAMPRLRILGNGLLSFVAKLVSGYWSVLDPTNGFTAIRADTLRQLDLGKIRRRYFFETSMLIELNIVGAVVCDVPLPARYHGERSSLRVWRTALQFPVLLMHGLIRRFVWRYVLRDFNALTLCVLVGLPSVLFGTLFGLLHWWRSSVTNIPATPGTTFLAALPIILGFQCLLVAVVLDILQQPRAPRQGGAVPKEPPGESARGEGRSGRGTGVRVFR